MTETETSATEVQQAVREKRGWFIALGIILILIGTAAIVSPFLATLTTKILVGWILVFSGIAQVIHAFWAKDWGGFFWELLIGLLQTAAGILLLVYPIAGIIALTIFLAATFIAEGVMRVILAFNIKPQAGWGWVLFGGIVSFAVGAMLWAELPSSALWAIGLLVGVNIAMAGWSLLMLAIAAGNSKDETAAA